MLSPLTDSRNGSENFQLNVNTDHSPCTNNAAAAAENKVKFDSNSFCTKNQEQVLNFMLINIQSIVSKKEAFWELLDTHAPDIIIGCETWLRPNIFDNEIIPSIYKLYRTDCIDGYAGVLVGVRTNTISQQIYISDLCEICATNLY